MAFHKQTFAADLDSDPMLKDLDQNLYPQRGHVDFPRVIKGEVNLSVSAVPTGDPPFETALLHYMTE